MKKLSFIFYYLTIFIVFAVMSFSLLNFPVVDTNYKMLFSGISAKRKAKAAEMTRVVSIAMADRIGNISFFPVEFQYEGDSDVLARKALEKLLGLTKDGVWVGNKKINGLINPETKLLDYRYDALEHCAYISLTPQYFEGMTTRRRSIAKKQFTATLTDVYGDLVDCKFVIDGKIFEW